MREHQADGRSTGRLDGRGNLIILSGGARELYIMPFDAAVEVRTTLPTRGSHQWLEVNADATLAVLRNDRAVAVVDLVAKKHLFDVDQRAGTVSEASAFSPDGSLIARYWRPKPGIPSGRARRRVPRRSQARRL